MMISGIAHENKQDSGKKCALHILLIYILKLAYTILDKP